MRLVSVVLFSSLVACTGLVGGSEPASAPVTPPAPEIAVSHVGEGAWKGVLIETGSAPCLYDEVPSGSRIVIRDGECTLTSPSAAPEGAPASPEPVAAPEPPAPPPLSGWAKVAGVGPAKMMRVHNGDSRPWTGCTITIDGTYTMRVDAIGAGDTDGTPYGKFKDGGGRGMPASQSPASVRVACDQGVGWFKPTF